MEQKKEYKKISPDNIQDLGERELNDSYYQQIEEAEKQIEEEALAIKEKTLTMRWNVRDYNRAKKIAAKLNIPYQTYIKMRLTEILNNDQEILFKKL